VGSRPVCASQNWCPEWESGLTGADKFDFYAPSRPTSLRLNLGEVEKIWTLGQAQPPSNSSSQVSSDPNIPPTINPAKGIDLSDLNNEIPASVLSKRPSLHGQLQQKVWLDDIKEANKYLRVMKNWLINSANGLTLTNDGLSDWLNSTA